VLAAANAINDTSSVFRIVIQASFVFQGFMHDQQHQGLGLLPIFQCGQGSYQGTDLC
jgi:hypothetical protein